MEANWPRSLQDCKSARPNRARTLLLMVLAALAIRLVVMAFLYPEQLGPQRDHWVFGYETGRIARSLAEGQGFSNPLYENTGPTAWMTPVYPYIVAGFFKVFGIYTKASALAILSFNALISALTCLPVFFFARRTFGENTARCAGWAWAFFPYGIYFPVERIWETWLATLILCILFFVVLKLEQIENLAAWAGTGALWGLAALTSPVVLSVVPLLHGWIAYRRHQVYRRWLAPNLVCGLAFLAVASPWFLRNFEVFHRFIPFRDNMGLVLRLGTKGPTDYWGTYELGPWKTASEWNEFQTQGELHYMDHKGQQALAFIEAQPLWYARTAVRRLIFLWTGYWSLDPSYLQQEPMDRYNIFFCSTFTLLALFGLWRAFQLDPARAVPYLLVTAIFPLVYYFTSPEVYYRRPIDPMLLVLAVFGVMSLRRRAPAEEPAMAEVEVFGEPEPELVEN